VTASKILDRAAYGGRTVIVGDAKDHATTDVIANIKRS